MGGAAGFTFSVWVKRSRSDLANDVLFDFGSGSPLDNIRLSFMNDMKYEVYRGPTDVEALSIHNKTTSGLSAFPANTWTHVSVVHEMPSADRRQQQQGSTTIASLLPGRATIWWNGEVRARGLVWLPEAVERTSHFVGRSWNDDAPLFSGAMHDIVVHNRALESEELDAIRLGDTLPGGVIALAAYTECTSGYAGCAPAQVAAFNGVNQYFAPTVGVMSTLQQIGLATPTKENMFGEDGFTISAWVYRSRSDMAWDRLIDFGNGVKLENIEVIFQHDMQYRVTRGSQEEFVAVTPFSDRSSAFPEGTWTHVGVVHETNKAATIYWNGVLMATGSVHLPATLERANHYIGKSHSPDDPYFHGMIRDLFVFNHALSLDEIGDVRLGTAMPMGRAPLISFARTWCS